MCQFHIVSENSNQIADLTLVHCYEYFSLVFDNEFGLKIYLDIDLDKDKDISRDRK